MKVTRRMTQSPEARAAILAQAQAMGISVEDFDTEYEVRIAELVAALDPFEPSDQALGSFEDDDTVEIRMLTGELLMAQPFAILRRAAAALSQKGEGDEPG